MPRSSWKGYLKLSLVSVPVKGYTAHKSAGEVRLNQLHEACHSRIKYKKTCPIHGEVPNDEIVSGYEYSDGQYMVIEPEEIDKLRTEVEKRAVNIDAVVRADSIDPVYFTDKTYYLLPDGAIGQKPYALIQQCLADDELQAIGRVTLFGREELVAVRPAENLLAMTALKYEAEVTHAESLDEEIETPNLDREELNLTKTLLKSFQKKKFSIAGYKDPYIERLRRLVEAKVEGKELVTPPETEEPQVINLMDALKRSVAAAQGDDDEAEAAPKRSKKKLAPSRRRAKPAKAKRKSG